MSGAGDDPLTAAGTLTCGVCKAESWPVDATWVTGSTVLASFDQAHEPWCSRRKTACGVVLIDGDAETPAVPNVHRPRICRGTVRNGPRRGQPCLRAARAASAYCSWHGPRAALPGGR